jgi:hypothetical protein
MNTIATEYATTEILGYDRIDRDGVSRRERVSFSDGRSHVGHRHAASMTDVSGPAPGYHERCGWCYLNAPHTADAHAAKMAT